MEPNIALGEAIISATKWMALIFTSVAVFVLFLMYSILSALF